jgi:hypothetical protein
MSNTPTTPQKPAPVSRRGDTNSIVGFKESLLREEDRERRLLARDRRRYAETDAEYWQKFYYDEMNYAHPVRKAPRCELNDIVDQFQKKVSDFKADLHGNLLDAFLGSNVARSMYLWPEVNVLFRKDWYERQYEDDDPSYMEELALYKSLHWSMKVFEFAWFYSLSRRGTG